MRQLLAGKILGNSVIALGQVVLFAAVGLVAVSFTDASTLLPTLSTAVVWFVLFFAVGFFALACLYAVAGALASRTEDLQSTTAPMTMVLMVVYVASFGLTGKALEVASFVPIASVVSMPGRLLAGDAAWWEPVLALLIMAAFSAGTIVVSERIYRRSLLQTRGGVSWKQALSARGVNRRARWALALDRDVAVGRAPQDQRRRREPDDSRRDGHPVAPRRRHPAAERRRHRDRAPVERADRRVHPAPQPVGRHEVAIAHVERALEPHRQPEERVGHERPHDGIRPRPGEQEEGVCRRAQPLRPS